MLFLSVLLAATLVTALAARRHGWRHHARWGLAVAMVVAGLAHLLQPMPFEQHLPGWVPARPALVLVTGVIEVALGLALVARASWRPAAGRLLAAYLVAVFPANVYVAVAGVDVDGQPGGVYPWLRLPLQALFVAWALWATSGAPAASGPAPAGGSLGASDAAAAPPTPAARATAPGGS